eukprot:UN12944
MNFIFAFASLKNMNSFHVLLSPSLEQLKKYIFAS